MGKYPDLRFGQLVCNIVPENQLFYVEDDIMLADNISLKKTSGEVHRWI